MKMIKEGMVALRVHQASCRCLPRFQQIIDGARSTRVQAIPALDGIFLQKNLS
jgi:hypothetical protein